MTEDEQLARVVALLEDVLGEDLVAAYLHGSAVLGGLGPRSDLDVLVVSRRTTTDDEKRRLITELLALSKNPRHLEVTIALADDLRPWRYPPRRDFQYGDWWRAEFEGGDLHPWDGETDRDLAVLVTIARDGDRPLVGPPARAVLDPVPRENLVHAMTHDLDALVDDVASDYNLVLTLARIWHSLETGTIARKREAAGWALAKLPGEHRPRLEHARAIDLGERGDDWTDDDGRARALATALADEIGGALDTIRARA